MMDNDKKIYRINSTRTNFTYTSDTPEEENILYNSRGISIFMLLMTILFFLCFSIFFATKYTYETKPNLTLEEFLNHRSFLIEKYAKIPKYIIPKQYHLVLHPKFNDTTSIPSAISTLEPFTYTGFVYITLTSKKANNKRIELNAKNLKINVQDVSVYRSVSLTDLDFDDDPDWNSKEIKYIPVQRNKREAPVREKIEEENNGGEVEDIPESSSHRIPGETSALVQDNQTIEEHHSPEINFKQYYYPILPPEDFIPIRVIDVERDESNDKINIYLATEMKKDEFYIVKVKFYGNMTHGKGFYFTYYDDDENDDGGEITGDPPKNGTGKTRFFGATFLEPNNARRLFPCMDDHVFRTPFDISIARTLHMTTEVASNLEDTEEITDEYVVDEYNTTASMKASEVGFTINNMVPHKYNINDNFSIIFYTRNKHLQNTKFASIVIPKIIKIYEDFTNQPFNHETLKYVAVPNSDLSLCEVKNGMILSSEMHILIDKNYTTFSEKYVHQQLTFEMALQWMYAFINYKTREHYWLHDALAQYLQTIALFQLEKFQQAEHLILEDRLFALREGLNYKSTSLMYFDQYHIDDDDYHNFIRRKAVSVLRMINNTIGENVLNNAIQQYFTKMKNEEYADFIECFNLTKINCAYIPRVFNVSEFIHRWISSERYPIVTVQRDNVNGTILLKQTYYMDEDEPNDPPLTWNIPISFTNSTTKNYSAEFNYWLYDDNYTIIYNAFSVIENDSWVLVNPVGKGYYRVNYDLDNWKLIINQLKTDHNVFPYETRAILIDDALNLARMDMLNYTIALDLLSYLMDKDENSLHPWLASLNNLNYLYKTMEELPNFSVVENFMRDIVNAVYDKINEPKLVENAQKKKILKKLNEDDEEKRLEYLIDDNSCMLGFPPCLEDMKNKFENLLINDDEVDNQLLIKQNQSQNELFLLLCTTIKYSGFFEWNIVYKSFNNTNDLNYRKILLRSLGCSREISLINSYINFLVNKEFFKFSADILLSLSENKIGMKYMMDYLYLNWPTIIKILDIKELSIIFKNISNENEYKVLKEIFLKYPETFRHRDKDILRKCRDIILTKLNWKNKIGQFI